MSSKAPGRIAGSKDLWSGLIFIAMGVAAIIIARGYAMGHAGRMGPGYFPTALGGVLGLVGLVLVAQALRSPGEAGTGFAWRKAVLVLAASGLFGVGVERLGLAASILLLVMIAGLASERFRLGPFLALAAGLSAFSSLVFVTLLGLPIPIIGPWLGG